MRGGRGGIIMTNDPDLAKKIDRWVFPGYQGGPLFHAIVGKASCILRGFTTTICWLC
ncbi:hypothetical protein [Mycoplasmopsis cynos]|uniref:hypothetical protein n=1 Tax=Mycoplasmopsis cynos TaxID=171284 RepID=UPI002FF2F9CD